MDIQTILSELKKEGWHFNEDFIKNNEDMLQAIADKTLDLQLQQTGVRRSIYEYFTDAEIVLFAHLVKEHSKATGHSEYKQGKLDKLEAKLKQLRSF